MAKQRKRQIDYLPQGWEWRYKGEQTWTTPTGKQSDERHAYNVLTGQSISTRQAQNMQNADRAKQGTPKAPTIHRTGKIRTIKQPGKGNIQTNVTKSNTQQTGVGSLFNVNVRGNTETWVFYNLQELRQYIYNNGLPDWVNWTMIEVRYTERLVYTTKVGSDQPAKNGYASLTPFRSAFDIQYFVDKTGAQGAIRNPWDIALDNIKNYDMTGPDARVYLYLAES